MFHSVFGIDCFVFSSISQIDYFQNKYCCQKQNKVSFWVCGDVFHYDLYLCFSSCFIPGISPCYSTSALWRKVGRPPSPLQTTAPMKSRLVCFHNPESLTCKVSFLLCYSEMMITVYNLTAAYDLLMLLNHDKESDTSVNAFFENK